jgi:hypothetical protein
MNLSTLMFAVSVAGNLLLPIELFKVPAVRQAGDTITKTMVD